jgi:hypothetical protein
MIPGERSGTHSTTTPGHGWPPNRRSKKAIQSPFLARRESKEFLKKPSGLNPSWHGGVLLPEPRIGRVRFWRGVAMKKKLGVLVLTLSSLVISAACASSSASTKPKPPQPDSGENWAKAGPSELLSRPANAAAVHTTRLASR